MLQRPLPIVAYGAFLASQEVASYLLAELTLNTSSLWYAPAADTLRAGVTSAMVQAMDKAWPRRFRLNELEGIAELVCPKSLFVDGKLPLMNRAFDALMLHVPGAQVVRREDRVQQFVELASEIDPSLLVAWHLAHTLSDNGSDEEVLREQVKKQSPLFDLIQKGDEVADNHVHLGGVSAQEFVMSRYVLDRMEDVPQEARETCRRLRELAAVFVQIGANETLAAPGHAGEFQRACFAEFSPSSGLDWQELAQPYPDDGTISDTPNWLRGRLAEAAARGEFARAWLLLCTLLLFLYSRSNTSAVTRVAILYFLVQAMVLRRSLIVDGQGLRRFATQYYQAPLRKNALDNKSSHSRDSVERLFAGPDDLSELKVAPDAFGPALPTRLAQAMALSVLTAADDDIEGLIWDCENYSAAVASYLRQLERWHFCAHFIRGDPPRQGGRRTTRTKLWRQAQALLARSRSRTGWNSAYLLGGAANMHLDFHGGRWLRALDVAGDETAWPIEYYAAQLRWLRNQLESSHLLGVASAGPECTDAMKSMPGASPIHFSIHAGEDYSHPLSGLRHVDETIRFCCMRAGDRLGHALALGVEPRVWMEDHGDVLLPLEEHLDNLIWCWHYAGELSGHLEHADSFRQDLETRIWKFVPHVIWATHEKATVQDFFDAWLLRINCPVRLDDSCGDKTTFPDQLLAVPDLSRLSNTESPDLPRDIYKARILEELAWDIDDASERSQPQWVLVRPREEVIAISPPPNCLDDFETEASLQFMQDLQDHLLNKCVEKKLIIETNPTSNLYISRLKKYSEHPIFRWNPPDLDNPSWKARWNKSGLRADPVPVLINTDDPGIMPTTLRTELALIEAAAFELGYTKACVKSWLQKIREFGVSAFRGNHVQVFRHSSARDKQ